MLRESNHCTWKILPKENFSKKGDALLATGACWLFEVSEANNEYTKVPDFTVKHWVKMCENWILAAYSICYWNKSDYFV